MEKLTSLNFAFLCLIFSFIIFGNTLNHPFLFDDEHLENYQGFYNLANIPKIFTSSHHFIKSGVYRPMTSLSYVFNRLFFGDSPSGYRIVQILIYALNGWLLFLILRILLFSNLEATFIPLLFLSYPVHNELVNVVVFRHELLAVFFGFLAILCRLKSKNLFLVYTLFFASILSKESGAMILVISWYILWLKQFKGMKKDFIFSTGLVLFYSLSRFMILGKLFLYDPTTIVENPLRHVKTLESILTALKIIGLYLGKLIFPVNLSIDYSYNQVTIVKNILNGWSLLGLSAILLSLIILFNKKINYKIRIAWAFFLFPILLVSNIFFKIGAIMADRWLYLPSLLITILVVLGVQALSKNSPITVQRTTAKVVRGTILSIIITLFVIENWQRNSEWEDNLSLYKSTARVSQNSVLARTNLAAAYLLKNDLDSAEKELKVATEIYPHYSHLLNNWGILYFRKGDFVKAKEYFFKTLERYPEYFRAHENLAIIFEREGNYREALKHALAAYELVPISRYANYASYLQKQLDSSGRQK